MDKNLFFKLFKNNVIRNQIITQRGNYEDLKFISKLLTNYSNGLEIVKIKIKNDELLEFNKEIDLPLIYSMINENTLENLEFYNKFFKRFSSILNVSFNKEQFEIELSKIIKSSNIVALKSYLKIFTTTENGNSILVIFNESIKKVILKEIESNFEIIKGVKELVEFEDDDGTYVYEIELSEDQIIYKLSNYKQFKMFKYLIKMYDDDHHGLIPMVTKNKIKLFKLNYCGFNSIKLKQLIKLNEFISKFKEYDYSPHQTQECPNCYSLIQSLNYDRHLTECYNDTRNKNGILKKEFEENQLNQPFLEILDSFSKLSESSMILNGDEIPKKNTTLKDRILNLLERLFHDTDSSIFSKLRNHINYMLEPTIESLQIYLDNYNLLNDNSTISQLLFHLIKSDKDNLPFIEILTLEYGSIIKDIISKDKEHLFEKSIISNEILEFYYKINEFKFLILHGASNLNWQYIKDMNVLIKYEELMFKYGLKFYLTSSGSNGEPLIKYDNIDSNPIIIDILLRILKNPNDIYIISNCFKLESFSKSIYENYNNGNQEKVCLLFKEYFKYRDELSKSKYLTNDFNLDEMCLYSGYNYDSKVWNNKLIGWIIDECINSIDDKFNLCHNLKSYIDNNYDKYHNFWDSFIKNDQINEYYIEIYVVFNNNNNNETKSNTFFYFKKSLGNGYFAKNDEKYKIYSFLISGKFVYKYLYYNNKFQEILNLYRNNIIQQLFIFKNEHFSIDFLKLILQNVTSSNTSTSKRNIYSKLEYFLNYYIIENELNLKNIKFFNLLKNEFPEYLEHRVYQNHKVYSFLNSNNKESTATTTTTTTSICLSNTTSSLSGSG